MKFVSLLLCWVFVGLGAAFPEGALAADDKGHGPVVAFLNPHQDPEHTFWGGYSRSMKAAAENLGISLYINYHSNRFELQDALEDALRHGHPDYLISILYRSRDVELLQATEQAGVGILIGNTDLLPEEKEILGAPGEKFRHWVGHIVPDDFDAGRELTRQLYAKALESGLTDENGKVCMLGVGGGADSVPALQRKAGMEAALQTLGGAAVLEQWVFTAWKEKIAYVKTLGLLDRHPQATVLWVASDEVGKGVLRAVREAGLVPGQDILIGSIDGSPWSLKGLRTGELAVVVGGHFLEGAFDLVYLYDLSNGFRPSHSERFIAMPMYVFTRDNLHDLEMLLDPKVLSRVDFKAFTKTHGNRNRYAFSVGDVLLQLRGQ